MYHSDILMLRTPGRARVVWFSLASRKFSRWSCSVQSWNLMWCGVAGKGLRFCAMEWNQNNICPYISNPSFSLRVVVTPAPRGLSFSLATQLICTNYSLLIEITLNQSILGECECDCWIITLHSDVIYFECVVIIEFFANISSNVLRQSVALHAAGVRCALVLTHLICRVESYSWCSGDAYQDYLSGRIH